MTLADDRAETGAIEVWRGGVAPWRCDQMGHMNMRYYVAIAEEGLAGLAAALDRPRAPAPLAVSAIQAKSHHVRFLREARVGASLSCEAGVLAFGEDDARVLQVIRHADGRPAATVVSEVAHAAPSGRPYPWPARARSAADRLVAAPCARAGPKSVPEDGGEAVDLDRAEALGLTPIARGVIQRQECDDAGAMTATAIFGRASDGGARLFAPLQGALAEAHPDAELGWAALEYRLDLRRRPRAGEAFLIRSAFTASAGKVVHLAHWLLDPAGGAAYGALRGVIASFDLKSRKALAIPDAVARPHLVASLTP